MAQMTVTETLDELKQENDSKMIHPNFTGKWQLKNHEGIEDFLQSEGWNWIMRKIISSLGNTFFIYHQKNINNQEYISIKSINTTGHCELVRLAAINKENESKLTQYKDKNNNNVTSIFKWNTNKTELIECLSIEIKNSTARSWTKTRYINKTGELIITITNETGKYFQGTYIKQNILQEKLEKVLQIHKNKLETKNCEEKKESKDKLKLKFEEWLCDIVKLPQYLLLFEKNEYNDIRMIQDFDQHVIKNEIGISKSLHCKLLLRKAEEFREMRQEFSVLFENNVMLKSVKIKLEINGILTASHFFNDIKSKKELKNVLDMDDDILINIVWDMFRGQQEGQSTVYH